MSKKKKNECWTISIFVPGGASTSSVGSPDPSTEDHARPWIPGAARIEKISDRIFEQWDATIQRVMQMSSAIGGQEKNWSADEIQVGFTLSAKGELLFIAEAGAQASITVKLKRMSSTR